MRKSFLRESFATSKTCDIVGRVRLYKILLTSTISPRVVSTIYFTIELIPQIAQKQQRLEGSQNFGKQKPYKIENYPKNSFLLLTSA